MPPKAHAHSNDRSVSGYQKPEEQRATYEQPTVLATQKARTAPRLLAPADMLRLQRAIGNRAVSQLVSREIQQHQTTQQVKAIQRAIIYEAHPTGEAPVWQKKFFAARRDNKDATTGVHNYAIDFHTKAIARSNTSAHAEILLIAMSQTQAPEEILLISEYKPCPSCQKEFDRIEKERGISIRVLYLLPYENKGDGDVNKTREYYKKLGYLSGGGDFVYSVTQQGLDV